MSKNRPKHSTVSPEKPEIGFGTWLSFRDASRDFYEVEVKALIRDNENVVPILVAIADLFDYRRFECIATAFSGNELPIEYKQGFAGAFAQARDYLKYLVKEIEKRSDQNVHSPE